MAYPTPQRLKSRRLYLTFIFCWKKCLRLTQAFFVYNKLSTPNLARCICRKFLVASSYLRCILLKILTEILFTLPYLSSGRLIRSSEESKCAQSTWEISVSASVAWYMYEGLETDGLQSIKYGQRGQMCTSESDSSCGRLVSQGANGEWEGSVDGLAGWKKSDVRLRSGRWWPIMRV